MTHFALDTSVAVPLLLRRHAAHHAVLAAVSGNVISMTGHSQAETYSVLTRLPGDARVDLLDAARLLSTGFAKLLVMDPVTLTNLPSLLSSHGVAGGAVYDAMVALAVKGTRAKLLTRDARAAATYAALEVPFVLA